MASSPRSSLGLEGQVLIVAGGTRGIGRALAGLLSRAGARVVVASRDETQARATAATVARTSGRPVLGVAADTRTAEGCQALVGSAVRWGRRLDGFAYLATFPFDARIWNTPLVDMTPEDLEAWFGNVWRTDLLGAAHLTRAALPPMRRRKKGAIVYVGSTPAIEGYQGSPYTTAKAGVLGLMKDIAYEYGPHGIRANAVALGNIRTPATWDELSTPQRKAAAAETPLRRWGEPEEAAKAIVFLLSSLASYVNGQTLVVDGGALRR